MMWRRKGSLPKGDATCNPCRRVAKVARLAARPTAIERYCQACGESFMRPVMRGWKVYCDPCRKARDKGHWRDSWYRRQGVILRGELFTAVDILREYGASECHICGDGIDIAIEWPAPMSLSLDHVVPLSRGGEHTRENVRPAHLTCNIRKGAKMDEDAPA